MACTARLIPSLRLVISIAHLLPCGDLWRWIKPDLVISIARICVTFLPEYKAPPDDIHCPYTCYCAENCGGG